jgi:chemosensory pili system protein ChpA (sensor histidine kinase/response regulator)
MLLASPTLVQSLASVRAAMGDALNDAVAAVALGNSGLTQWRGAHAALQVVNHAALVRYSAELGTHFESAGVSRVPALRDGVAALLQYIDRVTAGAADQPLRLAPAYEALQQARGAPAAAADLYFPDLTCLPPAQPVAQALSPDELRALRREFEGGLLQWLKKGDAMALAQVGDAVAHVESASAEPVARRPWWIAHAVIDALLNGGLEPEPLTRRLLTQLNLYLGRIVNGPSTPPDSLLRDALYLVARARPVTPLIGEVRTLYALDGVFETEAPAPAVFDAALLAGAREQLEALKLRWAACVESGAVTADFSAGMNEFSQGAAGLGAPALAELAASVAQDVQTQAARGGAVTDAVAFECACALLMMEIALSRDTLPAAEFVPRARHMASRLRVAVATPDDLHVLAPAQLLDEASQRQQLAEPLAAAHDAVVRALHEVELTLDAWFRDLRSPDAAGGVDKPLKQAGGALSVLGHAGAARLAADCRDDIARHAAGEPCGTRARQALVSRLAALRAFVEGLKLGAPDLDAALKSAGLAPAAHDAPDTPDVPVEAVASVLEEPPLPVLSGLATLDFAVSTGDVVAPAPATAAVDDAPVDGGDDTDGDLLEIFLEEADGVVVTIAEVSPRSAANPADVELLTELRRAFHTLKGSGRMVGLKHFGEAAWEMEQVFNDLSATGQPGTPALYRAVEAAREDFARWLGELRVAKRARIDAARLTEDARRLRAGEALPESASAPAEAEPVVTPVDDTVLVGDVQISRSLYDILLPEAREHAAGLARECAQSRESGMVSTEFVRAAHTLRGITATGGLPPISVLAQSLERVLQLAFDTGAALPADARASVERAVDALNSQIECLAAPRAVDAHPALIAELDAVSVSAPASGSSPAELTSLTLDFAPAVEPAAAPDTAQVTVPAVSLPEPEPALAPASAAPAEEVSLSKDADGVDRRQYRLKDDLDPQLLPIFLEEAAELVPQVGQDLRDWRARPDDKLIPLSLKRLLHTLKGSARMAGAMALGQLTHSMETRIENAQLLAVIPAQFLTDLETSFDRIGVLIGKLHGDEAQAIVAAPQAGEADAPAASATAAVAPMVPMSLAMDRMAQTQLAATVAGDITQAVAAQPQASPARQLIRVRADLVDRLSSQAGEISIARARVSAELRTARNSLRDLTDNVNRLRAQLREIEIQAETQMQSRMPTAGAQGEGGEHFDPLEFDRFTRLQELTRLMAESVNDVATVQRNLARDLDEGEKALNSQAQITREVQEDLMAIRMVPLSSLSDRLYRVARLSARDNGKHVNMVIEGGHVEMDRGVIERVAAPIEHLLRNAIVHGIEATTARAAAGKPEAGSLKLTARQEGNEIVLALEDDGAGLNIARIREKAIALGLMRENERLSDQQIGNFIFRSGFSTAGAVTADAGRGVGMDVVMSEITSLGGRVDTAFQPGRGTTFTIHLPLTLSVLQAVVMRLGASHYAVPTVMVEQVQRLKMDQLEALRETMVVQSQGAVYPFSPLATLFDQPAEASGARHASVVLLRSGANRAAIEVDDILGGQELVIKNIGPQLARVPGVTGAAVLGSGETVLIINPVQLSLRYAERAMAAPAPTLMMAAAPVAEAPPPPEPERQKRVLVVDDSLTVRKITSRLLDREGYVVLTAKDGVDALEQMREELPDVMLTDVEMPRMDGFDLTRNVRGDERMKAVPVIMITSRTADKHREHAQQLGVDVFLGKPYEEGELLRHIAALAKRAPPSAPAAPARASAPAVAPLAAPPVVAPPVSRAVPPPAAPARQVSVLVVDDSLTVRKITGRLLTREGYAVEVAKDGVDALEKLRAQLPDVMLTDVEMPRMDGFELTRNVRADERLKRVPIIMITSRTADKHRERATELGVDVFLGKPYEEGELLRQIASLAERVAAS